MIGLKEHSTFKGFYYVLGFDDLIIDELGHLVDLRYMYCVLPTGYRKTGYRLFTIRGRRALLRHRAIALAFHHCPVDPTTMQVNHIDGNKENDHPSNLEWVTCSENSLHAYITGLRPDNKRIEIKDLTTGEVTEYYSLNEASRKIGVTSGRLSIWLSEVREYPLAGRYDTRVVGDEWMGFDSSSVGIRSTVDPQAVVMVKDDVAYLLESVTAGCRLSGLTHYSISRSADMINKRPRDGWLIYWASEMPEYLDPIPIKSSRKQYVRSKRKPVPILVTFPDSRQTHYTSVEAFCIEVGAVRNSVQKSMLINSGKWKDHFIEYLTEVPTYRNVG